MTVFYSAEATNYLNTTPVVLESGAYVGGNLRRYRATVTYATQATTDTIVLCKVSRGNTFAFGTITTSVSTGTATLAIGITGTTGKYKAAGAMTTTDVPQLFGIASAVDDPALTTDETIFITIGTASLPASGTLVVDMYFSGT